MGLIMIVCGLVGGFVFGFAVLLVLLPTTCICASWMMTLLASRFRPLHFIIALVLTALFLSGLSYFLANGIEMFIWDGILGLWLIVMMQASLFIFTAAPESPNDEVLESELGTPAGTQNGNDLSKESDANGQVA